MGNKYPNTESLNETEWIPREINVQNAIRSTDSKMYTYNQWNCHFSQRESKTVARISWGYLLVAQGTYCAKLRGVTLIESTQIWWFSRWSGEGGWSLLLEAKSLKTGARDHQAQVHSEQMVHVMARQEGVCISGGQTQRLHSFKWNSKGFKTLKWELENNSRQPKNLTENRLSGSLK